MPDQQHELPDSRATTLDVKNSVEVPLAEASSKATVDVKHSVEVPLTGDQEQAPPKKPPKFNWRVLKSLKLGQVISGIVILALISPAHRYNYRGFPEYTLIFVTYSVTVVTLLGYIDSIIKEKPLRKAFKPKFWFRVELWYTGLVALVFHVSAYLVLVVSVNYHPFPSTNVAASCVGFVAAGLYLVDWWRMFRNRKHETLPGGVEQIVVESSEKSVSQ